jgi:ubiquinone biosynthesis protein
MYKAAKRRRKAYWVSLKVGFSYLWLYLSSKIRGKAYWERKIGRIHEKNALRIKKLMLDLQGLFIKCGQLISSLSNVLPKEFRAPLEELQDRVPPHPFSQMEQMIEQQLGQKANAIFSHIDPNPIAAASIGQVHRASLEGKEVIIKIQHPQIDKIVRVDLAIIKRIVKLVARFMKIKGIEHLYQQVEQMIEEELDYEQEAQSMQLIKQNLSSIPEIYIPEVFETYSSKKVLTIEYCEGTKISNLEQLETWGLETEHLADVLVKAYFQMVLVDGFYHADPHPGNLLVNEAGQIILIDFGAVASLSPQMKEGIPKLIECTIRQDAEEMVKILRKLGFIALDDNAAKIAEQLIDKVQDFVQNELQLETLNVQDISPEQMRKAIQLVNIQEMTQIMQIPKDWVLLNRAVVLVSGVAYLLHPNWNPIDHLQPYIQQQLMGGDGGFTQMLVKTIRTQLNTLLALPVDLQKVLRKANKGKLEFKNEIIEQELKGIRNVGQQLIWVLFFFASVYFYMDLKATDDEEIYYFFAGTSVFSFFAFIWAFLRRNAK